MTDASNNSSGINVGRLQVGTVYAKAFLAAAEKAGKTDLLLEELDSFIDDVLSRLPKLESVLTSSRVSHEAKVALLDRAFAGKMVDELLVFLKVVSSHDRLDCLRAIRASVRKLFNELRGRVEIQVKTAEPLNGELQNRIADTLRRALGKDIDLKPEVDPDLIGGLVVSIGDTVYDGSVVNQLARLRVETMKKSAQDMQDTLDRFLLAE